MARNSRNTGKGQVSKASEVWAYLRVSTDGQESGTGLDVQTPTYRGLVGG